MGEKLNYTKQYNRILAEAVEKGLSIICLSATNSILYFLKNNGSIRSESNIESVERLSEGLWKIFGCGSKVIEKQILKALYTRLQLSSIEIQENFDLAKEVEKAFKSCRSSQNQVDE